MERLCEREREVRRTGLCHLLTRPTVRRTGRREADPIGSAGNRPGNPGLEAWRRNGVTAEMAAFDPLPWSKVDLPQERSWCRIKVPSRMRSWPARTSSRNGDDPGRPITRMPTSPVRQGPGHVQLNKLENEKSGLPAGLRALLTPPPASGRCSAIRIQRPRSDDTRGAANSLVLKKISISGLRCRHLPNGLVSCRWSERRPEG